jgi:hypothetical protein
VEVIEGGLVTASNVNPGKIIILAFEARQDFDF